MNLVFYFVIQYFGCRIVGTVSSVYSMVTGTRCSFNKTLFRKKEIDMARISAYEAERRAVLGAHRSMFGCDSGGHDFDEPLDPTEAMSAPTAAERAAEKYGLYAVEPDPEQDLKQEESNTDFEEIKIKRRVLTPNERTKKKRAQRKRKKAIRKWPRT